MSRLEYLKHASARLKSVDLTEVRTSEGVVDVITTTDIPGERTERFCRATGYFSQQVEVRGSANICRCCIKPQARTARCGKSSHRTWITEPTLDVDLQWLPKLCYA